MITGTARRPIRYAPVITARILTAPDRYCLLNFDLSVSL